MTEQTPLSHEEVVAKITARRNRLARKGNWAFVLIMLSFVFLVSAVVAAFLVSEAIVILILVAGFLLGIWSKLLTSAMTKGIEEWRDELDPRRNRVQ